MGICCMVPRPVGNKGTLLLGEGEGEGKNYNEAVEEAAGVYNKYLQLLCREIIEFLLTRGEVKILISRKSCTQFYRLLE